jgi:hypothetical protein
MIWPQLDGGLFEGQVRVSCAGIKKRRGRRLLMGFYCVQRILEQENSKFWDTSLHKRQLRITCPVCAEHCMAW